MSLSGYPAETRGETCGGAKQLVRIFVAIGGLVVLALLGVLIAPFFIDWTAYRADFEREATRILGQRVVVKGAASARLLPFPSVSFDAVEVEGAPGEPPLVTARRFAMDAELAPYLSGELRIFSMRIEDPVVSLALGTDGRLSFPPAGGRLPTSANVVLEEVSVANGTVRIADAASGRTRILSNIEGRFAARSLAGPVMGGGTFLAENRPLGFQLATGVPAEPGVLPLRLTIDDPALLVSATMDGTATFQDGALHWNGALRAARSDPPKPETGAPPPPPPKLPPFALTGRLSGEPGGIEVADLRLSVGSGQKPYILTGRGSLFGGADPRFALDLRGEQVDVDAVAGSTSAPRGTLQDRLNAARAVLDAVPRPDLPGTIALTLPVVVAGDTTIRDLTVEASPKGRDWTVRRLRAELPGRTRLEAAGSLEVARDMRFRGSLLVAARQPSGLSEWLTGSVDPALRGLAGAGFSATVDLAANHQRFDDLEIDIGGDKLAGRVERSGEGLVDTDLTGGRIDVDALVAFARLFSGEADSPTRTRRGSLKLGAGPVAYGGTTAERIDADLSYDGEALSIVRADLKGLAASDLSATGRLTGLGGDPAGRIELALNSRDPSELIGFLSQRLPPGLALDALQRQAPTLGPLAMTGTVATVPGDDGERPTLNVSIEGTAARTNVALRLALGNGIYARGEAGRFGGELTLTSADPPQLLGQIGIETLPLAMPSPLSFTASLSAGATGPVVASAALRAPGSEVTGEGTLALSRTGFEAGEFATTLKSDDLSPWLLGTGNSFGASGTDALPALLSSAVRFDASRVSLDTLEGSVGAVDLSGNVEKVGDAPVAGSLFLSQLSLPWLATLAYGQSPLDPVRAAWNAEPFARSLLPAMPFALDVTTDSLSIGGTASVGNASARIESAPGLVEVSDIQGAFAGGYGTGSVTFRNAEGFGGFSATADLQGLDLGSIALFGLGSPVEAETDAEPTAPPVFGTMDMRMNLDGSGSSYASVLSALTGGGQVRVEDGGFAGVTTGLLPSLLSAADREGFEPSVDAVARLVASATGASTFPVPHATGAFTVVGGVARFAPMELGGLRETLTAEGSIALATNALAGRLRLDLDPGDEALEGTAPAVDYALHGTLAAPRLDADVQPLANFLSARALEREQSRVEAIQGALQEKLRLRREARLFRWREARRIEAAETLERLRIERLRREEQARIERENEAARREAERRARAAAAVPRSAPFDARPLDLESLSGIEGPLLPPVRTENPDLPGVRAPANEPSASPDPF